MAVVNKNPFLWQLPTMNTWSDCEFDDKISFNFIVDSGIFDLSGGL